MMRGEWVGARSRGGAGRGGRLLRALHLDGPLLLALSATMAFGLFVLYSALGGNTALWLRQVAGIAVAVIGMVVLAQVPPRFIRLMTPLAYAGGIVLLLLVALFGDVSKGAQRWLDLGFIRFQPSEMMKVAVPLMCAWYVHERPLPPSLPQIAVVGIIFLVPAAFIAEQPDLDTALLVCASGFFILLLGGLQARWLATGAALGLAALPIGWHLLHDYQRRRVLTLLDPESDPLGAGYHIIQSQIAIGSGGVFGKGWMNGSQAQLEFLPERSTDFIFAVVGEELGLLGQLTLIALYVAVLGRALYLAAQCNDTFGRLVAGSIALTFFVYVFVNSGMVVGLLPVMGLPLPLVSYGGTSMVTLLAGFGILQGLHSHRKLVRT
jgi:rod shape determining protein RodA